MNQNKKYIQNKLKNEKLIYKKKKEILKKVI